MNLLNPQEAEWVEKTAGDIRSAYFSLLGQDSPERQALLKDELGRRLQTVPAPNRRRLGEALLRHFPVAGQVASCASTSSPAPPASNRPAESPDELFERLLKLLPSLPAEKQAEWRRNFSGAGAVEADYSKRIFDAPSELRKSLGMQDGQQPRLDRVFRLLVDLVRLVDQMTSSANSVSGGSGKQPAAQQALASTAGPFLAGELESIEPSLKRASSIIGNIILMLKLGPEHFGRKFIEGCGPSAVEDLVKMEGNYGRFFKKSYYEACWEKYKALFQEYQTPQQIAHAIERSMTEVVRARLPK